MKKAQKILMIVAGVVSIVMILVWAIYAGIFYAVANNDKAIDDYIIKHSNVTRETVIALMIALGVMFTIFAVCSLINAIVAFRAKNTDKKGLLIINIVFGILSGVSINIVGAIFGFVARNQKKKPAQTEE